jgi:uncharacterized membrane protein
MSQTKEKEQSKIDRLLISPLLRTKNRTHQMAYVAVTTAFIIAANMFFEFKLVDTQFSLTLAISALSGIILGAVPGFVACFLGDLVGFLYHSSGYAYMPWIGIAMGVAALITGFVVQSIPLKGKKWLFVKLAIASELIFIICTVAINTTAFWLLYAKGVPYGTYFVMRIFVQGQIWNTLFNTAVLFAAVPALCKVKALQLGL